MTDGAPRSLAIVGAGPSATSLLERLVANAPELVGPEPLRVHLVDPHPPGGGRVWRHDQSALLWMNSMAEDVTMFTDTTVHCEGPVVPGPSLAEWAALVAVEGLADPALTAEARATHPMSFPTRQLQSAYLAWVYDGVAAAAPPNVCIQRHRGVVAALTDEADGRQRLELVGEAVPLLVDVVVLALGHLDVVPGGDDADNAAFARARGLFHLPPAYSADVDLSGIEPGADVIVRGLGLAFIDLMVLLTEGRGGRYVATDDGGLRYVPSGREPRLLVGSRRGVPYHSKIGYRLQGEPAPLPRFFDRDAVTRLLALPHPLDFRADVWPLLAKDIAWGYYHELFSAHPERTALPWDAFAERYAELPWGDAALADLIETSVPFEDDRFDVERIDRPFRGARFADADALQDHLRVTIEADLDRRADPAFSADLGAFRALLAGFGQLGVVTASGRLTARSQVDEVAGWWFGFFSFFASGPPAARLQQLLALSRAGIVRFLGPGMWVQADDQRGVFRAGGSSTTEVVEARALIEARLPALDLARVSDPLLVALRERGELAGQLLADGDGAPVPTGKILVNGELHTVGRDGRDHPRRFALGAPTSRPAAGTFARPRTNAAIFRQNDALARRLLQLLGSSTTVGNVAGHDSRPEVSDRV